jgi:hypothetical protein
LKNPGFELASPGWEPYGSYERTSPANNWRINEMECLFSGEKQEYILLPPI